MIEPNCDMPWDIYLDWLQDQGNEDLREINPDSLVSPMFMTFDLIYNQHDSYRSWGYGLAFSSGDYGNGLMANNNMHNNDEYGCGEGYFEQFDGLGFQPDNSVGSGYGE